MNDNTMLQRVRNAIGIGDVTLDEVVWAAREVASDEKWTDCVPLAVFDVCSDRPSIQFYCDYKDDGTKAVIPCSSLLNVIYRERAKRAVGASVSIVDKGREAGFVVGVGNRENDLEGLARRENGDVPRERGLRPMLNAALCGVLDAYAEQVGFSRMRLFGKVETDERFRNRINRAIRTKNRIGMSDDELLDIFELAEDVRHVGVLATRHSDVERAMLTENADRYRRGLPVIHSLTHSTRDSTCGFRLSAIIDIRRNASELPEWVKSSMDSGCEVVIWRDGWQPAVGAKYGTPEVRAAVDANTWKRFFIQGAYTPYDEGVKLAENHGWPDVWGVCEGLTSEPTEHDRMAAFFATSEHKRHEDETEPDWAQLDRFLPDECAMPSARASGTMSESVQYRQVKGVVEVRAAIHLESGTRHGWWRSLDVFAKGPFPSPWHLERYHDAVHAQKLINEAISGLPRVRKS